VGVLGVAGSEADGWDDVVVVVGKRVEVSVDVGTSVVDVVGASDVVVGSGAVVGTGSVVGAGVVGTAVVDGATG
jgi:hypothetical protein